MLVAKLDYLQLVAIKGSLAYLGKRASQLWKGVRSSLENGAPEDFRGILDGRCVACHLHDLIHGPLAAPLARGVSGC
jgi:hypothetical protein